MDKLTLEKFKEFVDENKEILNDNNFEEIYNKLYWESAQIVSNFTQLFYKAGINPLQFLNHIPSCFLNMADITSFVIPNHIITIGNAAFYDCEKLEEIKLNKNLETIGSNVFAYCFSLKNIEIPDKVKKIGKGTFRGCSKLESISIGKNLNYIAEQAFKNCGKLKNIYFRGNFEEFDCRIVLSGNNYFLFNITLHCLNGDYKYNENINEWVKI